MNHEGPDLNEKARDDDRFAHLDGLYDQNEDFTGETIDAATGKRYRNDRNEATDEVLGVREPGLGGGEDVLGALPEEEDAAAKWLRENADRGGK